MDAAQWDDSALIHAFNSAMSKYQEMHGTSKKSKGVQQVKSTSFLPNQDLDEHQKLTRHDGSKSKAGEPQAVECEVASHVVDQEGFATPEAPRQGQQADPEEPYSYDPVAMDGYANLPGADQYYALQQICSQLKQLELQQQVLRQQLQTWTGLAGWNGMQHHANHGQCCQTQGGYPSSGLPFSVSAHVYPCYCHYLCPAQSSWTCRARRLQACFPACPVHGQPSWCHASCSLSCSQGHQLCRAQHQNCPVYLNPPQHVCGNLQDAEMHSVDK